MRKGLFISLEGSDGAGKSTQLALLSSYLVECGYIPVITREPGGTPLSEKIRALLLDKKYSEMDARTEALLYAAARAQHVVEVIKPALGDGKVVICDRFIDSSLAYQGYGRKLGEDVVNINDFATAGCIPDITFLFKLKPEISRSRIGHKDKDRLESEQAEFYDEVSRGYAELEKKYPDRIVGIDAANGIEEIHATIRSHLDGVLKGHYDI